MSGLAEFLLARIAEDEAWLRGDGGWYLDDCQECAFGQQPQSPYSLTRLLAKCEADRRIVEAYREARQAAEHIRDTFAGNSSPVARIERSSYGAAETAWWSAMAALALPYADRPGYREEWRP